MLYVSEFEITGVRYIGEDATHVTVEFQGRGIRNIRKDSQTEMVTEDCLEAVTFQRDLREELDVHYDSMAEMAY